MREKRVGRWVVYLACALGFGVVTFAATPAHADVLSNVQTQAAGWVPDLSAVSDLIYRVTDWEWS